MQEYSLPTADQVSGNGFLAILINDRDDFLPKWIQVVEQCVSLLVFAYLFQQLNQPLDLSLTPALEVESKVKFVHSNSG